MGWVADCADLAVALAEWAKKRYQSDAWKKKLDAASQALLLEDVDLRTAEETVKLAHQAGYAGPELDTVEERIAAIRKYERQRGKPRASATKMRKKKKAVKKKPAAPKPVARKAAKRKHRKS